MATQEARRKSGHRAQPKPLFRSEITIENIALKLHLF
jgi:hypothetical protein